MPLKKSLRSLLHKSISPFSRHWESHGNYFIKPLIQPCTIHTSELSVRVEIMDSTTNSVKSQSCISTESIDSDLKNGRPLCEIKSNHSQSLRIIFKQSF